MLGKPAPTSERQRGETLVEVLAAVLLMGLLVIGLIYALGTAISAGQTRVQLASMGLLSRNVAEMLNSSQAGSTFTAQSPTTTFRCSNAESFRTMVGNLLASDVAYKEFSFYPNPADLIPTTNNVEVAIGTLTGTPATLTFTACPGGNVGTATGTVMRVRFYVRWTSQQNSTSAGQGATSTSFQQIAVVMGAPRV